MKSSDSLYEIVTDEKALLALKEEWDDLWKRANGSHYQSFAFCWIAWQQVCKPRRRLLRSIVRRDEGRLALVWPLVTHIKFLWISLCPLSPEAADYSGILVDPGVPTTEWIEGAWRIATQRCGADYIHLPYLHEDAVLYRVASVATPLIVQTHHDLYVAKISEEFILGDWASFCNSLDTAHEKKPGSVARRLENKGKLERRLIDPCDRVAIASTIDLMLEWKRDWSDRVGKHGSWVDSIHYRNFLVEWTTSAPFPSRPHLIAFTLDGVPLTSLIFCAAHGRVYTVIGSFNPEYHNFSPGILAFEYVVKWAFDRKFDVDFGPGAERYKQFWSRSNLIHVWTLRTVASWWGGIGVHAQRLPLESVARVMCNYVVSPLQRLLRNRAGSRRE
jgi:CelD/BcsL family acetyltransferase involved in cellulose biosynthesis